MSTVTKESLLKFKHATIDTDVEVAAPLIFSIYLNQKVGSTLLVSNGGAIIPVKETVAEATNKLKEFYSNNSTKGVQVNE